MNNNSIKKSDNVRLFSRDWGNALIQRIADEQENDNNYEENDSIHPSREKILLLRGVITGFCVGLTYALAAPNHRVIVCLISGIVAYALGKVLVSKIYRSTNRN